MTPSCTCPDPMTPCKHILFVYIRILSLSTHYPRLRRRTLRPNEVFCLLHTPVSEDSFASETLIQRFHELYKVDDDDDDDDDDDENGNGNGEQEQGKYINLSAYMDNDDDDDDDDDDVEEEGDGDRDGSDQSVNGNGNGEQEQGKYINLSAHSGGLGNGQVNDFFDPNLVLWPPLQEALVKNDKINDEKKNNENIDVEKSSVDLREIEKKLFVMERYASILHGCVFGKPFEEKKDIPISLQNSGSFDVGIEWENMLESCDQGKLVRLEMFYCNMLAGVKDKIMKKNIKEIIKECLESSTSMPS